MIKAFFRYILPWSLLAWLAYYPTVYWLEDRKPASDFFVVSEFLINSSFEGEKEINLIIDREIKQDFIGSWIVNVRKITKSGLVTVCNSDGANNYIIDARLPEPPTLNWLTFPVKCLLGQGSYRVDVVWSILGHGSPKLVKVYSNIFEVRPTFVP